MGNEKFYAKLKEYQARYPQIIIDKNIGLSFSQVRTQIAHQQYEQFYNQKHNEYDARKSNGQNEDWKIDNDDYGIPIMNQVFYNMLLEKKKIPTWEGFLDAYKQKHCHEVDRIAGKHMRMMTLKSDNPKQHYIFQECSIDYKLVRAYMSFLKEVYTLFWFYDKNFTHPYYSLHMDLCGYDIVCHNMFNRLYGIKIYANTRKAQDFVDRKREGRSAVPIESTSISLVSRLGGGGVKIGDTYVFSDKILHDAMYYINDDNQSDTIFY